MIVYIKTVNGKNIAIEIDNNDLVYDIKYKLQNIENITIEDQDLIDEENNKLQNEKKLNIYNIKNGAYIYMLTKFNYYYGL